MGGGSVLNDQWPGRLSVAQVCLRSEGSAMIVVLITEEWVFIYKEIHFLRMFFLACCPDIL